MGWMGQDWLTINFVFFLGAIWMDNDGSLFSTSPPCSYHTFPYPVGIPGATILWLLGHRFGPVVGPLAVTALVLALVLGVVEHRPTDQCAGPVGSTAAAQRARGTRGPAEHKQKHTWFLRQFYIISPKLSVQKRCSWRAESGVLTHDTGHELGSTSSGACGALSACTERLRLRPTKGEKWRKVMLPAASGMGA